MQHVPTFLFKINVTHADTIYLRALGNGGWCQIPKSPIGRFFAHHT